jgi:hypothetical protein
VIKDGPQHTVVTKVAGSEAFLDRDDVWMADPRPCLDRLQPSLLQKMVVCKEEAISDVT